MTKSIRSTDIDVEARKIAGRPYIVKHAYAIEKGEAIWTQTAEGYELWEVMRVDDSTVPVIDEQSLKLYPSGKRGFIGFACRQGNIVHDANGGVYVDIKRGK